MVGAERQSDLKKARNVMVASKFNDFNILPLSHCCSIFCAGQALLEANKCLPLNILARYDQKLFQWTSNKRNAQEHRKSSILNILRISPYGSGFCRRRSSRDAANPCNSIFCVNLKKKNRTRLRRESPAFSIIYPQNLGNNRLIPEASRAPVPPASARAGETPTAPLPDRRSKRSGIPARSCAAARSAPLPDGIAR